MSEHVLDRLSGYLDDELSEAEQARLRAHIAGCPGCARRLEELAAVDGALRHLPEEAPTGYFEALPARIRSRLAAADSSPRTAWQLPAWALAVAAAIVVGLLAPLTLRNSSQPAVEYSAPVSVGEPAHEVPAPQAKAFPAPTPPRETLPAAPPAAQAFLESASRRGRDTRAERPAADGRLRPSTSEEDQRANAFVPQLAPSSGSPRAYSPSASGQAAPASATSGFAAQPEPAAPKLVAQAESRAPEQPEQEKAVAGAAPAAVAPGMPDREAKRHLDGFETAQDEPTRVGKMGELGSTAGLAKGTQDARAVSAFQILLARSPRDAREARALREEWRRLAGELARAAEADEARVRVLEMGAAAWRFERLRADRVLLEKDIAAYLAREDAQRAPQARALRDQLGR